MMPLAADLITITQLCIYPVKSLGGFTAAAWMLTPEGLAHDRCWMLVDQERNFVTQRKYPQMGKLAASLSTQHKHPVYEDLDPLVNIRSNDGSSVSVRSQACKQKLELTLWKSPCEGYAAPQAINHWINQQLGTEDLTLVTIDPCFRRQLDTVRFGNHTTAFADAAPVLLANQASLEAVNQKYGQINLQTAALTMDRFRANIVISGLHAFDEHAFSHLRTVKSAVEKASKPVQLLDLVDHCQRCSMITIDESSYRFENGKTLFETIAKLNPMPNNPKTPAFGVNCVPSQSHHVRLAVGDNVELR